MPWTCPTCNHAIHHDAKHKTPRSGVVYRCPTCRVDLAFDGKRGKLSPISNGTNGRKKR